MALCIYELSLFPMHSYHCGRNLQIYVTVVNRSSILSWMISEWFSWSWDMHKFIPIYLPTLLFYCLCLKSWPNVNLQMKRDIELQKHVAHTSIWLGKRKSDQKIKCMMPKKSKACSSNWNIKNFKHRSQNEMYWFKKNQMIWCIWSQMKRFKIIIIKFLWEVIYAYFYNWDGSHYLVLIVYALVELIIETSH